MSSIIHLSDKDFLLQNIISNDKLEAKPIVLLIKAAYCGHCTRYLPTFENLSKQFKKIQFCVLEYTDNQHLIDFQWKQLVHPSFVVKYYPTIVLYDKDGTPLQVIENREELKGYLELLH